MLQAQRKNYNSGSVVPWLVSNSRRLKKQLNLVAILRPTTVIEKEANCLVSLDVTGRSAFDQRGGVDPESTIRVSPSDLSGPVVFRLREMAAIR